MSRSNPTANNPNPSTKWLEWKGSTGQLVWFDKEKKENVPIANGFKFLVLDQLSTVTGYNKKAKSGIYANEIRDSRQDTLIVKLFSGDTIAEGLWAQIKEKVTYAKGGFACSCYIALNDGGKLAIGNIRFSGCSLGPWFDFVKKHRKELDTHAVQIKAGPQDTSGSVDYTPPIFSLVACTDESNLAAVELDRQLQEFLSGYLKRTRVDQVNQSTQHHAEDENQEEDDRTDYDAHKAEQDKAAQAKTGQRPPPPPQKRPPADPDLDAEVDDIPFNSEAHDLVKNVLQVRAIQAKDRVLSSSDDGRRSPWKVQGLHEKGCRRQSRIARGSKDHRRLRTRTIPRPIAEEEGYGLSANPAGKASSKGKGSASRVQSCSRRNIDPSSLLRLWRSGRGGASRRLQQAPRSGVALFQTSP